MIRWTTSAVALVLMLVLSVGVASAQDAGAEPSEKFYNFDDMLIDGDFMSPQGLYENARDEAKFERLLKLKKSFLDKIEETAQEDALD